MRIFQSSIFRAIVAIAVGILLVKYREDTMRWITIAAGGLFFISGAISFLAYLYEKHKIDKIESDKDNAIAKKDYRAESGEYYDSDGNLVVRRKPMFPILGIGCMILGVILAVMPANLITGVAYVLAGILILGSINQVVSLALARRYSSIPLLFWLLPFVTLTTGIIVIARPMEAATLPLKIIGWGLMVYGVVECVNSLKIYSVRKAYENLQKQQAASAEQPAAAEPIIENDDDIEDAVIVEEDITKK